MDRALRIIGVALVVALPIWAYRSFDRAVSAASAEGDTPAQREADDDPDTDEDSSTDADVDADADTEATTPDAVDGNDDEQLDAFGEPPDYLAFDAGTPGLAARVYQVADLPDVRDRDEEPDPTDYPAETDLATDFSLAPAEDIVPGLYASSFDAEGCSYELRRVDRSGDDRLIGQERLGDGRLLVSLNPIEPDVFSSVPQCRSWVPWSPLVAPLVQASAGDYWIGDLAKGTWSVPDGCLWEKVVAFRGARLADVTDSGLGPEELVVDDETM
ncbi:MAG: hypothetical protein AAFO29_12010, partial [Actinomycetota bacterium]